MDWLFTPSVAGGNIDWILTTYENYPWIHESEAASYPCLLTVMTMIDNNGSVFHVFRNVFTSRYLELHAAACVDPMSTNIPSSAHQGLASLSIVLKICP